MLFDSSLQCPSCCLDFSLFTQLNILKIRKITSKLSLTNLKCATALQKLDFSSTKVPQPSLYSYGTGIDSFFKVSCQDLSCLCDMTRLKSLKLFKARSLKVSWKAPQIYLFLGKPFSVPTGSEQLIKIGHLSISR
jgi:hypothetical protein